ncbi:hypothetical protein ASD97_24635 [Streptomyces sp. Root63]|uniref:hypothetical protein n=1 Tax=Streptomyces TaxID=1883 RepID=UPI000701E2D1|nr:MULTISPECIES: hypothetical protein [unclassified Streptomyces]KQX27493.1 hypothetical protein ASD29_29865 [Streptomyces sp. Root1295]KRA34733.1 hypothetical protein ASD97_24635 [Streptomyces sp. Root63]WTC69753.1 hypothetical protein OG882_05165 [Streptomyces anulatus]
MTRRLSVAERHAAAEKDLLLTDIAAQSTWTQFLVEQAVYAVALNEPTFSCNLLRDLLPELGHGFLGAAINAMRQGGLIEHTGQYVPSTSQATHGHPIAVWRLSIKGSEVAAQRRARAQGSAA